MSQTTTTAPLTVVLVHGAFADSSSWAGVIERLQANGVQVIAAANPLRGISTDSAYVASVFDQIPGPVLAVGHSYGGAVISNAATARRTSSVWSTSRPSHPTRARSWATSRRAPRTACSARRWCHTSTRREGGTGTEFSIDPAKARDAFAADLSDAQAALIGTDPATGGRARVRRAVRGAGVEDAAVVGGRGHQRPGRRDRRRPRPRRTGRRHTSPRSTART